MVCSFAASVRPFVVSATRPFIFSLFAAALACATPTAWGASRYWNAGTADWFTAGNWSTNAVPTGADDAYINNGGTAQIQSPGAVANWLYVSSSLPGISEVSSLMISNGGRLNTQNAVIGFDPDKFGSVTVDGSGSIWTTSGNYWELGRSAGNGTLNITNGGVVNTGIPGFGYDIYIGYYGGTGTVNVDGAGSTWNTTGDSSNYLYLGYAGHNDTDGNGTLNITNGGVVNNVHRATLGYYAGDTGTATVDGTDSTWNGYGLDVGREGTGTLNITNGGTLNTTSTSTIAVSEGGVGTVTVDGTGSTWNSAGIWVGRGGTGTVNIINGGTLITTGLNAGYDATGNGTVTVDGTGSSWINTTFEASGGAYGTATFNITNGGTGSNTEIFYLGFGADSVGTMTVDGAGSTYTNNDIFYVGYGYDGSASGTLNLANGGLLQVDGNFVLGNAASSTGTLNIGTGAGAGILDTASVNTGSGSGTLNFNHSDSDYYFTDDGTSGGNAVIIEGTTAVNHIGSGTTFLTGTHTYTGDTTIDGGILFVNGSIVSDTFVNGDGTLGGTGTLGNVTINNGGTFAPGNSIGTTNVSGDVDFSGGGIYAVEVDAGGNSDLIHATGTATLANGSVQVLAEPGIYGASTDYTILTADTGLSGTYTGVTSNNFFLSPSLSYDANNVYLNLAFDATALTNVALTPNQIAVANLLTQLAINDPTTVQEILNQLGILSEEDVQRALDSLSGFQHNVNPMLYNGLMQRFLRLVRVSRGWRGRDARLASNFSSDITGLNSGDRVTGHDRRWWIKGYGGNGDIDRDGTLAGMDYREKGFALGVDMPVSDTWQVGLAGSYTRSDISGGGSDADVDSYQIAAYANWQQDDWYADIAGGYAWHDTDNERTVTVGLVTDIADSDYDSDTLAASVEVGKTFELNNGAMLSPYVGLEYARTDREDFIETGSLGNLAVDDEDHESIRSKFGVRISKTFKTDSGTTYAPSAHVAYVHEHGDDDNLMKAAFSAAPASTFVIEGHDIDRDRLQLGLGVTVDAGDNLQWQVGYDGEFAGSDDYHSLSATLRMRWE